MAHANECGKRVLKLVGLHIIGEAAKTFVSPAGVGRIFASAPQTAQRSEMDIFEMLRFEALGRAVSLNCGLWRERGIERMSTRRSMP